MRIVTFTYRIPHSNLEDGETVEITNTALRNGDLTVNDLQFLADDRESDIYVSVSVRDEPEKKETERTGWTVPFIE